MIAPKQGRSGGGLFTTDGYVAGVCNFAEPRGDHGLYATPRSIYSILDRNNLMALYAPVRGGSGALLASRDRPRARGDSPITIARGQSPDPRGKRESPCKPGDVTVPEPELAGNQASAGDPTDLRWRRGFDPADGLASHPPGPGTRCQAVHSRTAGKTEQTDLNIDPAADDDRFSHFEPDQPAADKNINAEDIPSAAGAVAEPSAKSRWRPARSGAGSAFSEIADH